MVVGASVAETERRVRWDRSQKRRVSENERQRYDLHNKQMRLPLCTL